jgi:uncharacterized protein YycO
MKNIVQLLFVWAILSSCGRFELNDGDLLFCVAESSAMSDAIVNATQTGETYQYDHVAVCVHEGNVPMVIEAHPKYGVVRRPLTEFLDDAAVIDGKKGVMVMRVKESHLAAVGVEKAVKRVEDCVGQPYDWSFLPNNGKLYCSELVYECYLDENEKPVFDSNPMTFKDKEGNTPEFWVELFKNNGEEIPEGVPGTNPNDMIKAKILEEVYCYFD